MIDRPDLAALGLLVILQARGNEVTTRADLARHAGRGIRSVDRLMRRLERDGLLRVQRVPGGPSRYEVRL